MNSCFNNHHLRANFTSSKPHTLPLPLYFILNSFLLEYSCFTMFLFACLFWATPRSIQNFPDQGPNPCLLQWQRGALTTGPPGRPPPAILK